MTARTDRLVTLFGGGGFIGRYVAQALFKAGCRVRIAERDPRNAFFLGPLGDLGQLQLVAADITRRQDVVGAVDGADAVINLVGVFGRNMRAVHVDGARLIAEAAAAAGAVALVHVSAIGADPDSPSLYGATKGEGEQAVRAAFAGATIIRPSTVFGPEDDFVNRFAGLARLLPVLPVLRGDWKMQPVYAADLGKVIAAAAVDAEQHRGRLYEIGGPQALTMREMNDWICSATGRGSKSVLPIPDAIGRTMARFMGWLPGAPINWDQWLMLQKDNVPSGEHPGIEAFGIRPVPLAAAAEGWLPIYRRHGRWAKPSPY